MEDPSIPKAPPRAKKGPRQGAEGTSKSDLSTSREPREEEGRGGAMGRIGKWVIFYICFIGSVLVKKQIHGNGNALKSWFGQSIAFKSQVGIHQL